MALSLPGFLRRGPQPLLGIDISSSSVKLVELSAGAKTGLRIERYAIEPIEQGAVVDGNIENPEKVSDAIIRAVKRSGARSRSAALALPSSAVISKRIMLPAGLIEEDYDMQVESEANQYIPFSLDEVSLDFCVIGPSVTSAGDVEAHVNAQAGST